MNKEVNPELAKLLKAKGFDVEQGKRYSMSMYGSQEIPQLERYNEVKWNLYDDYYLAPTIAEVIMWLYEKHSVWIYSYPVQPFVFDVEDNPRTVWIAKVNAPLKKFRNSEEGDTLIEVFVDAENGLAINHHRSQPEAIEAGIRFALDNLV